jgi:1-acyl-sn-glycerol-3-phosphate acyltransferase
MPGRTRHSTRTTGIASVRTAAAEPSANLLVRTAQRLLRSPCEYLVLYAALLCFGMAGLAFTCLSALLYPLLPRRVSERFGRRAIGLVFRTYLGVLEATGLLKLDLNALDALRNEPGVIIAPNHPCLLDAVFVISRVPQLGCIMKAAIWDNPVLGGGARLSGYIRNDSPRGMVRMAAGALRRGEPLLVFPEGTRTRGGQINPFKGGFALIAKQARAPIQTVFIESDSPFLSKGWPLLRKPELPLIYRARLGRRFLVEGSVQQFVLGLEAYYREELAGRPDPAPAVAAGQGPVAVDGHA